jgi:hypothetical protein
MARNNNFPNIPITNLKQQIERNTKKQQPGKKGEHKQEMEYIHLLEFHSKENNKRFQKHRHQNFLQKQQ